MSYKTILVHAEPGHVADRRMAVAVALAERFDAALIGVGAEAFEPVYSSGFAMADGAIYEAIRQRIEKDLPAAEERFRRAASALSQPVYWVSGVEDPCSELVIHARAADLIVASRPAAGEGHAFAASCADLVMRAGLPVLIAPDAGEPFTGRRIVVGWKNTREARAVLTAALPFLTSADEVVLTAIVPEVEVAAQHAELDQVSRRLTRHGARVATEVIAKARAGVAEDLERAADRHGADLIVVGAYAHSRVREWALGGMTEDLIASSSKFVLMVH
ncbi:MAG TPA: universal stress protein [Caulobacteraceae bacterium]|nr:universal stress protein [Caulobacteraceae bacterium]